MSQSGFGEHLRREREMRGVSLQEIAGATRISTRFLDALEREAWDRLPGGVFNRGFVRSVARFLGLEEEHLLAEYALAIGQPPVAAAPVQPPATVRKAPWIALAALGALCLAGAGWAGLRWYQARMEVFNAALTAWPPTPRTPGLPAPPVETIEAIEAPTVKPQALTPAPAVANPASPWAQLPPATEAAAPMPGSELLLKIDAERATFVKITSDGQEAFAGTMVAGEIRSFSAQSALSVETQDAGAVRMELNGRVLAPIGPAGQAGQITLERKNLKPQPGGPD